MVGCDEHGPARSEIDTYHDGGFVQLSTVRIVLVWTGSCGGELVNVEADVVGYWLEMLSGKFRKSSAPVFSRPLIG